MAQRPTVVIDETFATSRKRRRRARHSRALPPTPPSFHPPRNHVRRETSSGPHHFGIWWRGKQDAFAYLPSSWLPGTGSGKGQPTARPAPGSLLAQMLDPIPARQPTCWGGLYCDSLDFRTCLRPTSWSSAPPRSRKPTVLELWYTAAQGPTAGPRTRRTAGPSCCALLNCRAGSKPAGDEPAETTWVKRRGSVSSR